jgi:hypothetical protein
MSWTWIYQNADGTPSTTLPTCATLDSFPTREAAEAYIGDTFQELLDGGVEAVTLYEDEKEVFGPMLLSPA